MRDRWVLGYSAHTPQRDVFVEVEKSEAFMAAIQVQAIFHAAVASMAEGAKFPLPVSECVSHCRKASPRDKE